MAERGETLQLGELAVQIVDITLRKPALSMGKKARGVTVCGRLMNSSGQPPVVSSRFEISSHGRTAVHEALFLQGATRKGEMLVLDFMDAPDGPMLHPGSTSTPGRTTRDGSPGMPSPIFIHTGHAGGSPDLSALHVFGRCTIHLEQVKRLGYTQLQVQLESQRTPGMNKGTVTLSIWYGNGSSAEGSGSEGGMESSPEAQRGAASKMAAAPGGKAGKDGYEGLGLLEDDSSADEASDPSSMPLAFQGPVPWGGGGRGGNGYNGRPARGYVPQPLQVTSMGAAAAAKVADQIGVAPHPQHAPAGPAGHGGDMNSMMNSVKGAFSNAFAPAANMAANMGRGQQAPAASAAFDPFAPAPGGARGPAPFGPVDPDLGGLGFSSGAPAAAGAFGAFPQQQGRGGFANNNNNAGGFNSLFM